MKEGKHTRMITTPPEGETGKQPLLYAQRLQRRIIRLLLQHDEALFRRQFRHFYAESALPQLPLLQQYDRYIRLRTLSAELFDDILPRIRRQLSLKIGSARLYEEAPTRGDIDWPRTVEQSWRETPGQAPLRFATRLRKRALQVPENLLTVAILLGYRREVQMLLKENLDDEELDVQERQVLTGYQAGVERELAAPYAQSLLTQASRTDVEALAQQVAQHLRPGSSPYRTLLTWWQRFKHFRAGRADERRARTLASRRDDEKVNAWLYELWIALECIHLFAREGAAQAHELKIATDTLQCTFEWRGQHLRFIYNRQLDTATGYETSWENAPATRPDYTLERAQPLEVRYHGELIWREPPFVLDAKYYLSGSDPANTHGPLKKLLGDMILLGATTGTLFFPHLPEPQGTAQATRIVRHSDKQYPAGNSTPNVHLYRLEPTMSLPELQARLRAVLDLAVASLPARPAPICEGSLLNTDTVDGSHSPEQSLTALCPKKHIGSTVFDLVNVATDCLQNPRLCHIMRDAGQPAISPSIARVITRNRAKRN